MEHIGHDLTNKLVRQSEETYELELERERERVLQDQMIFIYHFQDEDHHEQNQ